MPIPTYSGTLGGLGSLTKIGAGTLTLNGSSGYLGNTIVNGGVLAAASTSVLPGYNVGSRITVNAGGTLALKVGGSSGWQATDVGTFLSANSNNFTSNSSLGLDTTNANFSFGVLSGSMGLTKLGGNTLTLTGASTFLGPTLVSSGTLQLGDGSGNNGSLASAGTITNDATLVYNNLSTSQTFGGSIGGYGSLTKLGNSSLVLSGSSTYSGPTTISAGTLQLGDGNGHDGTLSAATSITNNAALVFDLSGSQTSASAISGTGNLTKSGSGLLFLAGNNIYSGSTTVSGGTLVATNSQALPYSSVPTLSVTNSATLVLSVGGTGWQSAAVNGLVSTNNSGFAPGTVLGIDTANATGGFVYGFPISGSMGLTKFGSNSLTLTGNNTYSGTTTVNFGTLVVAATTALPNFIVAGDLQVNNGGTLTLNVGGSGWQSTDVASLLSHANTANFSAGSTLGIDTTSVAGSFTIGVLSGKTGLAKLGPNTLVLNGISTFSGSTTVSGGTLDVATGSYLQDSTLACRTTGCVAFDPNVTNKLFYVGGLSGAGSLSLQNTAGITLNVGNNAGVATSTVYSGALVGSGSLVKAGSSTLVFTGSNTYAGGTTISGGTLQLGDGNSGHDGSLAGSMTNNAALVYDLAGSQTYAGNLSGGKPDEDRQRTVAHIRE